MAFAPAHVVDPIARTPLPYGLFSAVTPRPSGNGRWENGITWEALTCDPAGGIGDPTCDPQDPTQTEATGLPKEFAEGGLLGEASRFTVYGSYVCGPAGHMIEYAREQATEHLIAREEARVERALWTGDLGNEPSFADATTATTDALAPCLAVAVAENTIAQTYGSLGVLHMSRSMAQMLLCEDSLEVRGQRLYTNLGTPVIAGAGYLSTHPDGTTEGTGWFVSTPAILLYRSEIFYPSSRAGDLLDRGRNDLYAVAERDYAAGWDPCGTFAYETTLEIPDVELPGDDDDENGED